MRILHVNDLDPSSPHAAGAEAHVRDLCQRQRDDGHCVDVFSFEGRVPHSWQPSTWWNQNVARRLARWLAAASRQQPVDVLHCHNFAFLSPSLLAEAVRCGVPVVATLHDFRHELDQNLPGAIERRGWLRRQLNRAKIQHVRSLLDATCTTLLAPSRELARRTASWVQKARVEHLPYAQAVPASEADRPRLGAFLFAGRLVREKGLETLVAAMRLTDAAVQLEVAGAGPLAATLASSPRTTCLGKLDREALQARLRTCRALVVPSEWLENSPLAVLEAQALGTPVIGTAVGGLPELLGDDRGVLIAPHDAIALASAMNTLQSNPEQARRIGCAGRLHVRTEHDPERCDTRLLSIYRAATAQPAHAAATR